LPQQHRRNPLRWIVVGFRRQAQGIISAVIGSWSATFVTVWAGMVGLVAGALLGLGVVANHSSTHHLLNTTPGQAITVAGVAGSAITTSGAAMGAVYADLVFRDPTALAITIAGGLAISAFLVLAMVPLEADLLKLRGCRRLSNDEARTLAPAVQTAGDAMGLTSMPRFVIMTSARTPNAWAEMQHVVVTTELLALLTPEELAAVIAHELHHWQQGDAVGQRLVWAAGLPVAILLNIGYKLSGWSPDHPEGPHFPRNFFQFLGWLLVWPAWVIGKLIIGPLSARDTREHEYEADAAAKAIGLGDALISALGKIAQLEEARSGWEACVMASHPPTKLRIEALQAPRPDDADYHDATLGYIFPHINS
jgi:Zn-dependent protease with chaperone function